MFVCSSWANRPFANKNYLILSMHLSETRWWADNGPVSYAGWNVVGSMKTSEGALKQIILSQHHTQSELPRPIPWNFMEPDLGCTSRIYFGDADVT